MFKFALPCACQLKFDIFFCALNTVTIFLPGDGIDRFIVRSFVSVLRSRHKNRLRRWKGGWKCQVNQKQTFPFLIMLQSKVIENNYIRKLIKISILKERTIFVYVPERKKEFH